MPVQPSPGKSVESPHDILRHFWGYDSFRPLQEDVIRSVLAGKDTLALMPTGGGKSLCYQVPALLMPGLCLVISPLIALMKDQVENLRKKNITAFSIFAGMTRGQVINTLKVASQSNCKFLYLSPERLETSIFKEYLPALGISLVAVDEAHCISQWGYDFRPPYLRIATLREELPGVPVMALTASATPEVQLDICEKLHFSDKNIFRQGFERPNLSYSVFKVDSGINKIISVLRNVPGSGIVYCKSRKKTKEISDLIKMQGISADFYHAGLGQEERNSRQEKWITDQTRVIVCTNAFGMGIDKPGVRIVIHADAPDSLENYYQEAGRAGRDGKKAYAVLLYDDRAIKELEESISQRFPSMESIREVYQAVANYLQIPSGGGQGQSYDFDITDFLKKFKLNAQTVLYSLKILEQNEWLNFTEQVFSQATVQFIVDKETLYRFEEDHPLLEPLVKTLLRSYEGIFGFATSISELLLAKLLGRNKEDIKEQLLQLHRRGIIEYSPQKDDPQVFFLHPRVRIEELGIDGEAFKTRKEKFITRIQKMVGYVKEETSCRSLFIARYFGDEEAGECGVCDNCLRRKPVSLSREEFEQINKLIMEAMEHHAIHSSELFEHLKGIRKEKAWKVLNFLQAENKIRLDDKGWINRT